MDITNDQQHRRIISRLHRINGQIHGLENQLNSGETPLLVITQFEAAISATKSAMTYYIESIIDDLPPPERQKLLRRLIRQN